MAITKVATKTSTKTKVAIGLLVGAGIVALAAGLAPRITTTAKKPDLSFQSNGYRFTGEFFTLRNEGNAGVSAADFASAGQVRFEWLDANNQAIMMSGAVNGSAGEMVSTTLDLPAGRVVGGPTGWKLMGTAGTDAVKVLSYPPANAVRIRLTTDLLNRVAESNERNNALIIPVLPDLVVQSLTFSKMTTGDVKYSLTYKNQGGTGPSAASFTIGLIPTTAGGSIVPGVRNLSEITADGKTTQMTGPCSDKHCIQIKAGALAPGAIQTVTGVVAKSLRTQGMTALEVYLNDAGTAGVMELTYQNNRIRNNLP